MGIVKTFKIEGLGAVRLYRRRGMRSLKLSVDHDGQIRLTMPVWSSYRAGHQFLMANLKWLEQRKPKTPQRLGHGMRVGKAHRLSFAACEASGVQTRLRGNSIEVRFHKLLGESAEAVQTAAKTAALRALKKESSKLLPQRLRSLSSRTGLQFNDLGFKAMKRRWGSCSSDGKITLNIFLMQLPWHLIDYVLVHELTHTKVMNHRPAFWRELESYHPGAKLLSREIRHLRPSLYAPDPTIVVA